MKISFLDKNLELCFGLLQDEETYLIFFHQVSKWGRFLGQKWNPVI